MFNCQNPGVKAFKPNWPYFNLIVLFVNFFLLFNLILKIFKYRLFLGKNFIIYLNAKITFIPAIPYFVFNVPYAESIFKSILLKEYTPFFKINLFDLLLRL